MIKSDNKLIQSYAIITGIVLCYYGYKLNNILYFLIGCTILLIDTLLVFSAEICKKIDYIPLNFEIRSGNKLLQFLAAIYGYYLMLSEGPIIVNLIGLVMFLGDGYLALFEDSKLCI